MTYIRRRPPAPLDAYIDCIYYRDQPMPYPREKILPVPGLDLLINFGGAFTAYEGGASEPFVTCTESWSVGLRDRYHVIDWPRAVDFFIVQFKPGGAYPFLRVPLSELHNQVVALDAIWGSAAAGIRERLYAAPTLDARFALLERLLRDRLDGTPYGFDAVRHAVARLTNTQGALSIRALSDEMGMSQKHLIAQFKRLTGATPKQIARVLRFQRVLSGIDPARPVDWTRTAQQALYYDQSHFIKDFEAFTGHSPSDYLRLRRSIRADTPEHAPFYRQLRTG